MVQTTLKVDGMMCGMCESHINDAVRNAFSVKKVTSSHSKGQTVNRLESIFMMGTSHASNEECAVIHQAMRGLGVVQMDHQARV